MEEREVAALDDKQAIFGSLFLLATTLDTVGDRFLGDLTTKQWYLMAMLGTFFAEPPTIGELAERMGTSHQNVKQIARRLEEKGFLDLERDGWDRRVLRVLLTERAQSYSALYRERDEAFLRRIFTGLEGEEMKTLRVGLRKLYENVRDVERSQRGMEG